MTNESMKTASAPLTHQTPDAKQGALDDIGSKWSKFSKHDLSALAAVIAGMAGHVLRPRAVTTRTND